MNRNFEEEYKKYADIDTPDLWSRIEAGVDKLEAAMKETEAVSPAADTAKVIDIASSPKFKTESRKEEVKQTKNFGDSRFAVFARRYGGMVAAVACGMAVLSAIGISKLASKGNYSAAPMAESAAPAAEAAPESYDAAETAEAEAAYEEAPMAEEAAEEYDEAPMADEAPEQAETFAAAEASEAEEAAAESHGAGFYDGDDMVVAAETNGTQSLNSEQSKKAAESLDLSSYGESEAAAADESVPTGETVMTIQASIVSISENTDKSVPEGKALICTLNITDPGDTDLKKGDEITAFVNPALIKSVTAIRDKNPDKKGQYEVALIVKNGDYILTGIQQI